MESLEETSMEVGRARPQRPLADGITLGLAVTTAGAAVMIYEFLAVRILARFFGGSLDVWASVIAVLLAGLSIGYALGGQVADRFAGTWPIGLALALAGLTGLFMEQAAIAVGERLLQTDLAVAWHPYLAAALVSFVPVLCLGAVLPQAIRLRAQATHRVGSAAGWMSALSTLGSILGVLLTVHLLLPRVGVRETLYGISGLLVLGGALFAALRHGRVLPALLGFCLLQGHAQAQIVYEDYSPYHHILVEDIAGERILRFDDAVQSTMSLADLYAGSFEYTEFFHVPMLLDPTTTAVLFVGLGGGSGPKAFLRDYPHVRVEVAEIDAQVLWVARKHFGLPDDPRLQVSIRDGRVYLQRTRQEYGAIIMDAYASGPYGAYLPHHLVTQEFLRLAWDRLANGGCLVYNVMGTDLDEVVRGVYSTVSSVFQVVYAFTARSSLNTVFVAQKIVPSQLQGNGARDGEYWPAGPWLQHMLTGQELAGLARALVNHGMIRRARLDQYVRQFSGIHGKPPAGPVYTDNYAPVDLAPGKRSRLRRSQK